MRWSCDRMWRRKIHVVHHGSEKFFVVNVCVGEVCRKLYEKFCCYFCYYGELVADEWKHHLRHINGCCTGLGFHKPLSQRRWWGPYACCRLLIAPCLFGWDPRNFFHFCAHRSCESENNRRRRKYFVRHNGTVRFNITH